MRLFVSGISGSEPTIWIVNFEESAFFQIRYSTRKLIRWPLSVTGEHEIVFVTFGEWFYITILCFINSNYYQTMRKVTNKAKKKLKNINWLFILKIWLCCHYSYYAHDPLHHSIHPSKRVAVMANSPRFM
jgi:hypothetical protein